MKYLFHEVRTPLNSLTMGIDMLKLSENLMPAEREYLDVMAGATEFMSDTLNNVLNLHKIEVPFGAMCTVGNHPFHRHHCLPVRVCVCRRASWSWSRCRSPSRRASTRS